MKRDENLTPTWYTDARCFYKSGIKNSFDEIAVKDPSIVFTEGKYHLFYTGVNSIGWWQMGYAAAPIIEGLKGAQHNYLENISEPYFCAPQVFYFKPREKWYIIYNSGKFGSAYSMTTTIGDPSSWSPPQSLGINMPEAYDFWIICDDSHAYIFFTSGGDKRTIAWRRTTLAAFPSHWSEPAIAVADTFEGVCVYRNLADGSYYLLSEDDNGKRFYELWSAPVLKGPWQRIMKKWASAQNLIDQADHWTDNVSHGEIIRSGIDQKMEIDDIKRVDFLIQGVAEGDYGKYWQIPYELGIIRNYNKQTSLP